MREQACVLLARLDAGPTESVHAEIGAWLEQDPSHIDAFLEMAALWDQATVLSELSTVFPLEEYCADSRRSPWRATLLAMAASLLIAIGTWIAMPGRIGAEREAGPVAGVSGSYETRVGEQSVIVLDDGSQMILNTNTRVTVDYSRLERRITLERGESHFVVAKDAARPFSVRVGDRVIEAVGTAFTVHQSPREGFEVTVTEGKVKLLRQVAPPPLPDPATATAAAPNAAPAPTETLMSLAAGEYAAVGTSEQPIETRKLNPAEIEVRLAWRHGMLLFQDQPLAQVLDEVSRYTSVVIEAEEAVRNIRVGGYFRAGDIDGLLLAMQENFPIGVFKVSDEHFILKPL